MQNWTQQGFTTLPNVFIDFVIQLNLSSDAKLVLFYLMTKYMQNDQMSDLEQMATELNLDLDVLTDVFSQLINEGYLSFELRLNEQDKKENYYSIQPLLKRIDSQQAASESSTSVISENESDLFLRFEQEFGRPLTQMELETVLNWLNKEQFDIPLILVALRQAVLHQALNIKYIDAILFNWKKQNIQTAPEAEAAIEAFNRRKSQQQSIDTSQYDGFEIPLDWKPE